MCAGLNAWDSFHHDEALGLLQTHLEPALSIAEAWRHGAKVRVLGALFARQGELQALTQRQRPTRALLGDLLANAERRAFAGRFDDALARLYRGVELAAEVDIAERYGFHLKVAATWPELSPELKRRAGTLLGLKETLDLASDIDLFFGKNGTLAQRLRDDYPKQLKPLLARRHESVLAHGLRSVGAGDYEALRAYLEAQGLRAAEGWPRW